MKKSSYILLFLTFASCTSNTIYKKPPDLIPKDTMVMLLQDMYIAESAKNVVNRSEKSKVNYLPLVFNKYKIDSIRFFNSNVYYTSKMEVYEQILVTVKNNLEAEHNKYKEVLRIKDSINDLEVLEPMLVKKEDFLEKNDSIKKSLSVVNQEILNRLDSLEINNKKPQVLKEEDLKELQAE